MQKSHVNKIHHGLFQELIHLVPDQSVDVVITSPPYADQRKDQYGGIEESLYPEWTVDWMEHLKRVLKPSGSVLLNIRPNVKEGVLSDYMLKTRLSVREAGWKELDEIIWVKPQSPPLGNNKRLRRSWESIHWFGLCPTPFCNPRGNQVSSKRLGMQSKKGIVGGYIKGVSDCTSGYSRSPDFFMIGTNEVDTSVFNTHPAQYPTELAEWLIKMFCPKEGAVLDPFIGSGTTAIAALKTGRSYIGFEKEAEYIDIASKRIADCQFPLHETNDFFDFSVDETVIDR